MTSLVPLTSEEIFKNQQFLTHSIKSKDLELLQRVPYDASVDIQMFETHQWLNYAT